MCIRMETHLMHTHSTQLEMEREQLALRISNCKQSILTRSFIYLCFKDVTCFCLPSPSLGSSEPLFIFCSACEINIAFFLLNLQRSVWGLLKFFRNYWKPINMLNSEKFEVRMNNPQSTRCLEFLHVCRHIT